MPTVHCCIMYTPSIYTSTHAAQTDQNRNYANPFSFVISLLIKIMHLLSKIRASSFFLPPTTSDSLSLSPTIPSLTKAAIFFLPFFIYSCVFEAYHEQKGLKRSIVLCTRIVLIFRTRATSEELVRVPSKWISGTVLPCTRFA